MSIERDFRELTDRERAVLMRLLEPSFPGRDQLRVQAAPVLGQVWECPDNCGTLELRTDAGESALVTQRVPVEAQFHNDDGPGSVLLHVLDGRLAELEFVYYTSENVLGGTPDVEILQVLVQPPLPD